MAVWKLHPSPLDSRTYCGSALALMLWLHHGGHCGALREGSLNSSWTDSRVYSTAVPIILRPKPSHNCLLSSVCIQQTGGRGPLYTSTGII